MIRLHFILFFLLFFLIYFGIHYYVYSQIVNGLLLPTAIRNYLKIFFLIASLSFFLGEFLNRQTTSFWVKPITYFGAIWLGVISIALSIFLIRSILLIFFHSQFFRYYSTVISLLILVIVSIYSSYNSAQNPTLRQIEIEIEKLPQNLSGFTIVQLSDLHLNSLKSIKWLEVIVNETNRNKPDLVVITGDLVDSNLYRSSEFSEVLNQFKSKYGVFAVTGNHEYYAGIDNFLELTRNSNITVLKNERVTIADSIELVGINDSTAKRFQEPGHDLKSVVKNCDLRKPVILLSHQPDIFNEASSLGVDLQLSGHTHAGQIPPMDLITMVYFKYPYGLYKKGSSYIYTTSGTGTWGPPMHLFSRSEIVKIILLQVSY